jgi:hypothetical protein
MDQKWHFPEKKKAYDLTFSTHAHSKEEDSTTTTTKTIRTRIRTTNEEKGFLTSQVVLALPYRQTCAHLFVQLQSFAKFEEVRWAKSESA